MADSTYYYSVDGTAVRGPVTADAIRRLCEQRILTASSLLCQEGAQEWQQVQPEEFVPSLARAPRQPAPADRSLSRGIRSKQQIQKEVSVGIGRLAFLFWVVVLGFGGFLIYHHLSFELLTHLHGKKMNFHDKSALIAQLEPFCIVWVVQRILFMVVYALRLQNIGHSSWLCLLSPVPVASLALFTYSLFAPPDSSETNGGCLYSIIAVGLAFIALCVAVSLYGYLESH